MSIRSLYNEARQALGAASDDPAFEAACLMQRLFRHGPRGGADAR